jgi:hypothetical protein
MNISYRSHRRFIFFYLAAVLWLEFNSVIGNPFENPMSVKPAKKKSVFLLTRNIVKILQISPRHPDERVESSVDGNIMFIKDQLYLVLSCHLHLSLRIWPFSTGRPTKILHILSIFPHHPNDINVISFIWNSFKIYALFVILLGLLKGRLGGLDVAHPLQVWEWNFSFSLPLRSIKEETWEKMEGRYKNCYRWWIWKSKLD